MSFFVDMRELILAGLSGGRIAQRWQTDVPGDPRARYADPTRRPDTPARYAGPIRRPGAPERGNAGRGRPIRRRSGRRARCRGPTDGLRTLSLQSAAGHVAAGQKSRACVKWRGIECRENPVIRKYKPLLIFAVTALVFAFAMIVLRRMLQELSWDAVAAQLADMPLSAVFGSALCTAGSYSMLTLYDYVAVRGVGKPLRWRQVAPISFMTFGISHSVGLTYLSGGSIRYRNYSALGFSVLEIAGIVALCTLTFAFGAGTLFGLSLLALSSRAAAVLHLSVAQIHGLGIFVLALIGGYVVLAAVKRTPLRIFGRSVLLPAPKIALAQIAVGAIDLCLAAGSLYVLVRGHTPVNYPIFLGLYVLALQAGVLSNVPGGVGVFESVLMLMLPGGENAGVVGGVLIYRIIYYLIPFVLALALLAVRELFAGRHALQRFSGLLWRWLELLAPRMLAIAVFAAGAVLLFSGATPEIDARMEWLRDIIPLSVLEVSHIAGSAIGVGLLILARGLFRRIDAAWWLTMVLLAAGVVASMLKGVDYEEATLLGILLVLLGLSRNQFYRRAPLLRQPFSPLWLLGVCGVVALAILLSVMSYSDVPYQNDLWWQFAFDGQAPRVMRAGLFAVSIASAYALWTLLSPSEHDPEPPTEEELARAAAVIANSPDTLPNLAMLGDKRFLFAEAADAFIMYQQSGRSLIAMGDPVGNAQRFPGLVWRYRELCDRSGRWPVFYQVSAQYLPLYLDLGLALVKLGEDARVYLPNFSLQGSRRADLRNEHRRAGRTGVRFGVLGPEEAAAQMPRLQEISDEWLLSKSAGEKGFSVGRFEPDYVRRFSQACVFKEDRIVAFATLWCATNLEELSIDLMRYGDDAPKGVMDFLFVELMLWAKENGYRWFNLGMAPLSGLEKHPLAPFWHKLGSLVQHYGRPFYNFDGLRRYKEKFEPHWRPRYLASPGGLALPRVALDAAALIAGGIREVVSK
jgi:phosphatidylglycerol lysyltransferase